MTFKERVYQQFLQLIKDKILSLETILNDLNESAKNETKSTAGDKHETALAMLQIEQENTRKKIAETIDKHTNNSISKLEEETFHLFMASNHFRLKEVISIIENFLLLFNPNNKYDLCRYWKKLEENGFDPVLEYNKAVEGFQIHYHPTAEDLFRIII